MPNETVNVTISGANGQTKSLVLLVPSGGTASGPVSWTGSNFGLDSITASAVIQGVTYTSNTAQTRWGVSDLTATVPSTNASGANSNTFWTFVVIGVFPDGTHTGPSHPVTTSYTHFFLQWTAAAGVSYYNVYCTQSIIGSAGTATATVGLLHGIGTGNSGNNSSTIGGGGPNFPSSITQLWMDDGGFFKYAGDGTAPPAANTTLAVPSIGGGTGNLTISPSGSSKNVGSVQSLTVTVSGIVFASLPYIPLLQGTSGSLPLYNSPSANVFNYPAYNGQAVNKATAAANAWVVSGDNTSWQGRVSVTFDGTNFLLSYNGAAAPSGADTTNLTLTADDIAWYNSAGGTYDVFSGSGGTSLTVLVEWLAKPTISSVSPTTALANGTSQNFTAVLSSPISPRQLGTQYATGNSLSSASFSLTNATVTAVTPFYNGSGWLTGWTVTATIPSATSNSTATMAATVTGVLTYLNGASFVSQGSLYYIGPALQIATINIIGASFSAPLAYSFSVAPSGPGYTTAITLTLTGIVFQQQNNPVTMTFIGSQFNVGAGTQTSRTTGTLGGVSGWLTTFTATYTSSNLPPSPGETLGFTARDSTSGLTVTYLSSTSYSFTASGGGGGTGGGCPAVEMYLDATHHVYDVEAGFALRTLKDGPEQYAAGRLPDVQAAKIINMDYNTQPCYRLVAENGAEVTVSGSTPVPTKETIETLARGTPITDLVVYASEARSGMHVVTDVGKGPAWSMLVETESVGMRTVARLYCGGHNFAAGARPGKYIYTHNVLLNVK
jgi:hypothetical protein